MRSRCRPRCGPARPLAAAGERRAGAVVAAAAATMRSRGVEPEYVELVAPDTFEPIDELDGEALLVLAARVGEVRLIDNAVLAPVARESRRPRDRPREEEVAACSA